MMTPTESTTAPRVMEDYLPQEVGRGTKRERTAKFDGRPVTQVSSDGKKREGGAPQRGSKKNVSFAQVVSGASGSAVSNGASGDPVKDREAAAKIIQLYAGQIAVHLLLDEKKEDPAQLLDGGDGEIKQKIIQSIAAKAGVRPTSPPPSCSQGDMQRLQQETEKVTAQYNEAMAKLEESRLSVEKLKSELEQKCDELKTVAEDAKVQAKLDLSSERDAFEQEKRDLSSKMEGLEQLTKQLEEKKSEFDAQEALSAKEQESRTREIEELKKEAQQLKKELEEKGRELDGEREKLAENDKLKEEVEQVTADLDKKLKEVEELRRGDEALLAEIKKLEEEIEAKKGELAEFEGREKEAQRNIILLQNEGIAPFFPAEGESATKESLMTAVAKAREVAESLGETFGVGKGKYGEEPVSLVNVVKLETNQRVAADKPMAISDDDDESPEVSASSKGATSSVETLSEEVLDMRLNAKVSLTDFVREKKQAAHTLLDEVKTELKKIEEFGLANLMEEDYRRFTDYAQKAKSLSVEMKTSMRELYGGISSSLAVLADNEEAYYTKEQRIQFEKVTNARTAKPRVPQDLLAEDASFHNQRLSNIAKNLRDVVVDHYQYNKHMNQLMINLAKFVSKVKNVEKVSVFQQELDIASKALDETLINLEMISVESIRQGYLVTALEGIEQRFTSFGKKNRSHRKVFETEFANANYSLGKTEEERTENLNKLEQEYYSQLHQLQKLLSFWKSLESHFALRLYELKEEEERDRKEVALSEQQKETVDRWQRKRQGSLKIDEREHERDKSARSHSHTKLKEKHEGISIAIHKAMREVERSYGRWQNKGNEQKVESFVAIKNWFYFSSPDLKGLYTHRSVDQLIADVKKKKDEQVRSESVTDESSKEASSSSYWSYLGFKS